MSVLILNRLTRNAQTHQLCKQAYPLTVHTAQRSPVWEGERCVLCRKTDASLACLRNGLWGWRMEGGVSWKVGGVRKRGGGSAPVLLPEWMLFASELLAQP